MRMSKARAVMNGEKLRPGYMVAFERKRGSFLESDHFPDKHAGEPLIETEEEAWLMAEKFAVRTVGQCINVYVIDADFAPVQGYADKKIENRAPAPTNHSTTEDHNDETNESSGS